MYRITYKADAMTISIKADDFIFFVDNADGVMYCKIIYGKYGRIYIRKEQIISIKRYDVHNKRNRTRF